MKQKKSGKSNTNKKTNKVNLNNLNKQQKELYKNFQKTSKFIADMQKAGVNSKLLNDLQQKINENYKIYIATERKVPISPYVMDRLKTDLRKFRPAVLKDANVVLVKTRYYNPNTQRTIEDTMAVPKAPTKKERAIARAIDINKASQYFLENPRSPKRIDYQSVNLLNQLHDMAPELMDKTTKDKPEPGVDDYSINIDKLKKLPEDKINNMLPVMNKFNATSIGSLNAHSVISFNITNQAIVKELAKLKIEDTGSIMKLSEFLSNSAFFDIVYMGGPGDSSQVEKYMGRFSEALGKLGTEDQRTQIARIYELRELLAAPGTTTADFDEWIKNVLEGNKESYKKRSEKKESKESNENKGDHTNVSRMEGDKKN